MYTCGDCRDVECVGHENPEQPACDEFTTEIWDKVEGVETLEIGHEEWDEERIGDIEERLYDLCEQITQLSELVSTIEAVFAAMNRAYMGSER